MRRSVLVKEAVASTARLSGLSSGVVSGHVPSFQYVSMNLFVRPSVSVCGSACGSTRPLVGSISASIVGWMVLSRGYARKRGRVYVYVLATLKRGKG